MRTHILSTVLILLIHTVATLGFLASAPSYAQNQARTIDRSYAEESKRHRSLFKTLPMTHISPSQGAFITALQFDHSQSQMKKHLGEKRENGEENLRLKGYQLSPFLGLSGKYLGLGAVANFGEMVTQYQNTHTNVKERGYIRNMSYGGLVFFSPFPEAEYTCITFTAGLKEHRVNHSTAAGSLTDTQSQELEKEQLRYRITQEEMGANLNYKLTKVVAVIPWINYVSLDNSDFDRQLELQRGKIKNPHRLLGDKELLWNSKPSVDFGLDLAIKLGELQINLGNVMGTLLTSEKNAQNVIYDQSYSLGFAYRFTTK